MYRADARIRVNIHFTVRAFICYRPDANKSDARLKGGGYFCHTGCIGLGSLLNKRLHDDLNR